MSAELIIEDQPKRIIQSKVFLEVLCGVNQKPASVRASPVPGFMHLAIRTPKAGPRLPKRDRLHQSTPSDPVRNFSARPHEVEPMRSRNDASGPELRLDHHPSVRLIVGVDLNALLISVFESENGIPT